MQNLSRKTRLTVKGESPYNRQLRKAERINSFSLSFISNRLIRNFVPYDNSVSKIKKIIQKLFGKLWKA